MDAPEFRALSIPPWLFGRQGVGVLLLVALIAATFVVTDIAFLAACLLLLGLLARLWAQLALANVGYGRKTLTSRAFCGDEIVLESTVVNPRPLPLPWLEVWERLPEALRPEGLMERSFAQPDSVWVQRGLTLWPYQRLRWRRKLTCQRRGAFQLGDARLRTGDPFGFFERERAFSVPTEMLVYPRVVPLRRLALPLHHPSLDVVSPLSPVTDPTRTATVRDYRPDDARRMIHWPTSARRGSLQVRVLEPASSLHVTLVLDVRGFTLGLYRSDLLEPALSALASLAVRIQDDGHPVAFLANGSPPVALAHGASVGHLQQVLEAMARLKPVAGAPLIPWLLSELTPGSTLVLAASDMSLELDRGVQRLRSAGFPVVTLLGVTKAPGRVDANTLYLTPGCDVGAVLEGRA